MSIENRGISKAPDGWGGFRAFDATLEIRTNAWKLVECVRATDDVREELEVGLRWRLAKDAGWLE